MKTISMDVDTLSRLIKFANLLALEFQEHGLTEKRGCYISIFSKETGVVLATVFIGEIGENNPLENIDFSEKAMQYRCFSIEKGERLFNDRIFNKDVSTSYDSRNTSKNKFAGAIAANELIYSCSGYNEDLDELMCLFLAYENETYVCMDFQNTESREKVKFRPVQFFLEKLVDSKWSQLRAIARMLDKGLCEKVV